MERLIGILGSERSLDEVNLALRYQVEHFRPPAVGAMHITCSDESEGEAAKAFQECFVEHLLPELKTWRRSPFRTANLGGRYEWGAIRIAETHFALRESANEFKAMLVKINAHVAVRTSNEGMAFGPMDRYQTQSTACGALSVLLDGKQRPFTHDLQSAICSEGVDRIAVLRDPNLIDPNVRMLFAAILSAKVQARRAVLDIQDFRPVTPTLYIVWACVTLNRSGEDTELTCGYYLADYRQGEASILYHGLGDDPTHYRLDGRLGSLRVEDDHLHTPRPARDHRQLVVQAWEQRRDQFDDPAIALFSGLTEGAIPPNEHANRAAQVVADIQSGKHLDDEYAKPILRMLLGVLANVPQYRPPCCSSGRVWPPSTTSIECTNLPTSWIAMRTPERSWPRSAARSMNYRPKEPERSQNCSCNTMFARRGLLGHADRPPAEPSVRPLFREPTTIPFTRCLFHFR